MSTDDHPILRFPRLRTTDALALAERHIEDPSTLTPSTSYVDQIYAPVGGPIVGEDHLQDVRQAVLGALEDARVQHDEAPRGEKTSWQARFDVHVGTALHESLRISRSEAAAGGFWSWLTLILLPDIIPHRYPNTSNVNRVLGGLRNVFSVAWWPVEVLGGLVESQSQRSLQVDEIVGLFERSTLSRDGALAVAYAKTVRAAEPVDRMATSREFAKAVRRVAAHTSWVVGDHGRLKPLWDEASARPLTVEIEGTEDTKESTEDTITISVRLGALELPLQMQRGDGELQPTGDLPWTAVACPATADPPDALMIEDHRINLEANGVTKSGHPRFRGHGRLSNGVTVRSTVVRRPNDVYLQCRLG